MSLVLGSNINLSDDEFERIAANVGLSIRRNYYAELKSAVIQRVNMSFTITIFESYMANKVLLRCEPEIDHSSSFKSLSSCTEM